MIQSLGFKGWGLGSRFRSLGLGPSVYVFLSGFVDECLGFRVNGEGSRKSS